MILNGRREVPLDLLQRAVERYKINPHYLFFGTGRMFLQGNQLQNIQIYLMENIYLKLLDQIPTEYGQIFQPHLKLLYGPHGGLPGGLI